MTTFSVPFFMGVPMPGFDPPGAAVPIEPSLGEGSPTERMGRLYRSVASAVAAADTPLVYAGDCCVIIGVLAGLQARDVHPTLVFFDAHGDFNTWDTTPSDFIGGMPLAMTVGRGEQTIVVGAGLSPIPEERAVLVGARDLDPGEDEAIAASAMTVVDVAGIVNGRAPAGPLYVHVDVDVVDPTDMPAVNYPAPGGPSLAEVRTAVEVLVATGRVVALSFSCWNPALPGAAVAAAATSSLAASFAAS